MQEPWIDTEQKFKHRTGMDLLEQVQNLRGNELISIYCPVEFGKRFCEHNKKKFQRIISDIQHFMEITDSNSHIHSLLKPLHKFLEDYELEVHRPNHTLVSFVSKDFFYAGFYPFELPEQEFYIANKFVTRPLEDYIAKNQEFYVLAMSQHEINLYRADNHFIEEMNSKFEDIESFKEYYDKNETNKNLQYHASAEASTEVTYHGHSHQDNSFEEHLQKYLKKVDLIISNRLQASKPLILAADKKLWSSFNKVANKNNYLDQPIFCSPSKIAQEEIHSKALELIENVR